jgi:hypothetical protein
MREDAQLDEDTFSETQPRCATDEDIALADRLRHELEKRYLRKTLGKDES